MAVIDALQVGPWYLAAWRAGLRRQTVLTTLQVSFLTCLTPLTLMFMFDHKELHSTDFTTRSDRGGSKLVDGSMVNCDNRGSLICSRCHLVQVSPFPALSTIQHRI